MPPMLGTHAPTAQSSQTGPTVEGRLAPPPAIVQEARDAFASNSEPFWETSIPVSGESETTLRASWHELIEILASHLMPEVPEVFEMPPVPKTRVRMRVRNIGPAPFVFIDDAADRGE